MWELFLGVILVYTAFQVSVVARLANSVQLQTLSQENRLIEVERLMNSVAFETQRVEERLVEVKAVLASVEKATVEIERVHTLCETIETNLDDLKDTTEAIERFLEARGG
jgi:hypothetical protein